MAPEELINYQKVQNAARHTLDAVLQFVIPGASEANLVKKCDKLQRTAGVDDYWYKNLPALVLAGERTTLDISSTPYVPSEIQIQELDLVTIDLNPTINGYCGDLARTYYIERGVARHTPQHEKEFISGAHAQNQLHTLLKQVAHPNMSFHELYQIMYKEINSLGFEMLDYLGHNVQKDIQHLDFISANVACLLGDVGFFTLEPRICLKNGQYGFKHENIYYFKNNRLEEL